MINLESVIEFDNLTLADCLALNRENIYVEISNGRIASIVKEENTTY